MFLGFIQITPQSRGHYLPYKLSCLDQVSVYRTIGPLVSVSQTDCGDIQLDNDLNYVEVESTTDNYDCLWRIEQPQGVLRYEVQYVENGDQAECEKYQLLVRTNDISSIEFPNIT